MRPCLSLFLNLKLCDREAYRDSKPHKVFISLSAFFSQSGTKIQHTKMYFSSSVSGYFF